MRWCSACIVLPDWTTRVVTMIDGGSLILEMQVWMEGNTGMIEAPPPRELLDTEVAIVRSAEPEVREQDTHQHREGGGGQ
jgi:hypothetical protein